MSIEREYAEYYLMCDNCKSVEEEPFEHFYSAVDAKKNLGWKVKKINGEWQDWCPDCQGGKELLKLTNL